MTRKNVRRQRRRYAQAEQPPRQRRNRHRPPSRVQHHHRARVHQPVHRQRHQPGRPPRLTMHRTRSSHAHTTPPPRWQQHPTTAPAAVHLITRSAVIMQYRPGRRTASPKAMGFLVQSPLAEEPQPRLMTAPPAAHLSGADCRFRATRDRADRTMRRRAERPDLDQPQREIPDSAWQGSCEVAPAKNPCLRRSRVAPDGTFLAAGS
jgi:hypothetical protein